MRQFRITKQVTERETVSLNKYLQEIKREELITVEEEANLARQIREGDDKAIEKLTKANLRFVVSVAKQYQHRGLPLSDLINEGNIGLIKAAKRFDETRGFKLISYAVWWIRQSIQNAIDEHSRIVRLPSHQSDMIKKVRKCATKMEQEFHREPSFKEVGEQMCISAEVVADIMRSSTRQVSIDAPMAGSEDLTLTDVIEDKDGENAQQEFCNESFRKEIGVLVSSLPSDEADVLRFYFGIGGKKPLTLDEIGIHIGHSHARIRQIKENALQRLKNNSRCQVLKEYLG